MELAVKEKLKEQFVIRQCHIDHGIVNVLWKDGAQSQFDLGWLKASVRNERFATDSLEYVDNPLLDDAIASAALPELLSNRAAMDSKMGRAWS